MPPLLDLSNELLYNIIEQIHPDDIINFSITCKDVYLVAKDAVSLHLEREEHYEEVVLDGCHRHEDNDHPVQILKELCMDWRRGEYVKTLEFKCCQPPPNPDPFPDEEDVEDTQRYKIEKRKDIVMTEKIMQDILDYIFDKFDGWEFMYPTVFEVGVLCYEAEKGERSALLVLLLLFTPNLEVIRLKGFTQATRWVEDAIFTLTGENLQRSLEARKPLMNLQTVELSGFRGDDEMRPDNFEFFMWFAALPSVRTLIGHYLNCNPEPVESWRLPLHSSNVTAIHLVDSNIPIEFLERLLAGIKSLKYFGYDHNHTMSGGIGIDSHRLLASLHEHAKGILESLTIWGTSIFRENQCGKDTVGRCLQDFDVLKDLHLSRDIYLEIRPWHGTGDHWLRREDLQPLVYALPPSIESIYLHNIQTFHRVTALFVDFAGQKELRLPQLRYIYIDYEREIRDDESVQAGQGGWRELKEVCEKVGVLLNAVMKE